MSEKLTVAIVGAGIGGISAALCLLEGGIDVHVYEQSQALGEVGAGLQIGPNASRILARLGLIEALSRTSVSAKALLQRRWEDGSTLLRIPLAEVAERAFGAPHFHVLRADLLAVLVGALPPERLHLGQRFVHCQPLGERVQLEFEGGGHALADALVGADGLRSRVRQALAGPDQPRFTGCVAYRGLIPAERLSALRLDDTMQIWLGPQRHLVHYFVAGRSLLNFVAITDQGTWSGESWSDRASTEDVLREYQGWHEQVRAILAEASDPFVWALCDRPPLAKWSSGCVTLLGDACHPMLPSFGQGASQAIEDGATLAGCLLARRANVPEALARYEALRLPRTSRVQQMSAQNRERFHLPDGPAQRERDAQLARGGPDPAVAWLFSHDAWAAGRDAA